MRSRSVFSLAFFLLFVFPTSALALAYYFSVASVGDVNFSGKLQYIGDLNGYDYFFAKTSKFISSADLSLLNLETSISDKGAPIPHTEFTFRSRPKALLSVKTAGFDAVSVANNHVLDYGKTAFLDTIASLRKVGVTYAGGGENSGSASKPAEISVNGLRIAFLAFSDVVPPGFEAGSDAPGIASIKKASNALKTIRRADKDFDFVLVSVHWGIEMSYTPSKRQVELARKLIDAGADAVFGHHPHVVQPVEIYKGRPIFYSLGNFVFSPGAEAGSYSMIARVIMGRAGVILIEAIPIKITKGQPTLYGNGWATKLGNILSSRSVNFKQENGILVFRRFKDLSFLYRFERFEYEYFRKEATYGRI